MSHDGAYGLAVFLFSGTTNTDDDFHAYIDALGRLKVLYLGWRERGRGPACGITVVEAGNPVPNARWRREIANVSTDFIQPAAFAMVTESFIVRGALTAINWLRPPAYDVGIFDRFDEAVAWMEERRGVRLPVFDTLLREARERAARGERGIPQSRA